jgi:predicted O-methyltransferase YrrM
MWPKIYAKIPSATLYIYSNVNNEWSNKVEPEKMNSIKDLLNDYANKNIGIHYKSWVSKKELAESWKTADIWFYPCTFQETFCLTALEAAASKTFAITNGLAALQNTVSNRGYIIEGDATTEEWQNKALEVLFKYMSDDPEIVSKKEMLVLENYKWSKTLSWKSQANKLLNEYLIPNGLYEYKGMYNWTNNVPDGSIKVFKDILNKFVSSYWKFQIPKQIKVLEVGTYSGTSLIEMIKYIPNSLGTALDLWKNYDENKLLSNMDNLKIKESFYKNIKTAGLENRIKGIQTDSKKALIKFIKDGSKFDIIFIDASHLLLDCYTDIVLSWEILEKGGYLIIDDYLYEKDKILKSPFEAVNHFFNVYKEQYNILYIGYRVFLEKTI